MRLAVRLFAGLAEAARAGSVELEWGGGTAGDLLARLAEARPELAGRLRGCRVAVDLEFVAPDARVESGEVAVIPPVSGG